MERSDLAGLVELLDDGLDLASVVLIGKGGQLEKEILKKLAYLGMTFDTFRKTAPLAT